MSQLNFFRLPVLLLVLVNAMTPTLSHAQVSPLTRNIISNEVYKQFKNACARVQDEEQCYDLQKKQKRLCRWTGDSCLCLPEEVAVATLGVTAMIALQSAASFVAGIALVSTACSKTDTPKIALPFALTGAGLMGFAWSMFSQFRFVRQEVKNLVSESNSSN